MNKMAGSIRSRLPLAITVGALVGGFCLSILKFFDNRFGLSGGTWNGTGTAILIDGVIFSLIYGVVYLLIAPIWLLLRKRTNSFFLCLFLPIEIITGIPLLLFTLNQQRHQEEESAGVLLLLSGALLISLVSAVATWRVAHRGPPTTREEPPNHHLGAKAR